MCQNLLSDSTGMVIIGLYKRLQRGLYWHKKQYIAPNIGVFAPKYYDIISLFSRPLLGWVGFGIDGGGHRPAAPLYPVLSLDTPRGSLSSGF